MQLVKHLCKLPESQNMKLIEKIATQVEELPSKVLSVEEIQDIVVKKLMASSEKVYCHVLSKL